MDEEKKVTNGSLALNRNKVIVIQPAERVETQKLRVAAYARVSTDSTDQANSFLAQIEHYQRLIAANENWTIIDVYADRGISGTSAAKRPDFQRMLTDCRQGRIDKILVKSISRFARNTKECLEIVRELKVIGVGVCFEEQNIDTAKVSGELLTSVFAALAQKESESISQNMRWSYQARMKSGRFLPSSTAFGYCIESKEIVVDEEKAPIIQRIFRDYLAGYGMYDIVKRLNADGVPSFEKKEWKVTTISYILSNERYIGDSLWQKKYATETLPAIMVRNHGERQQYYATGTQKPIIDKETFRAVQERRKAQEERFYKKSCKQQHPLQAKIYCADCGSVFTRRLCRGTPYWCCRSHLSDKEICSVTQIPEGEIYHAFLRLYHKMKHEGKPILELLISDLQTVRSCRMLWSRDIVALNQMISGISEQKLLLASMNQNGLVDPDVFIARSSEYDQQLHEAKQKRTRLLAIADDDRIGAIEELMDMLEIMPDFLPEFDGEAFDELVERVIAGSGSELKFQLRIGLTLTEEIRRAVR